MKLKSNSNPKTRLQKYWQAAKVLLFVVLIPLLVDFQVGLKILILGLVAVFVFDSLEYFLDDVFDGWSLKDDGIILKRIRMISGLEQRWIPFNSIESVVYHTAKARSSYGIEIKTAEKKQSLLPNLDEFTFAPVLKYLKEHGIPILINGSDHEIELYLEGKIDEVPMSNTSKVKGDIIS